MTWNLEVPQIRRAKLSSDPIDTSYLGSVGGQLVSLGRTLNNISVLESKSPGFSQRPAIRTWLDAVFRQRSTRRTITYADLDGDWSHLM